VPVIYLFNWVYRGLAFRISAFGSVVLRRRFAIFWLKGIPSLNEKPGRLSAVACGQLLEFKAPWVTYVVVVVCAPTEVNAALVQQCVNLGGVEGR
jgi:hypothetical protein